ncbi:ABC transporter permease [uncultured Parabacteroides sp.]|uniref:ABC transporter permease n=1 Tax=uncultured Parabacteroides sp. TaxID=512312 RepID=UPI00262430A6|nr:ABC transporter permease [uncultured Parabacteroides sp.]
MKTILRNLLSVLRRFKMATLLNVLGLSVAFAAFILIMTQVDYDRNFDRGYTDTESIFRVETMFEDGRLAVICRPLADAFIRSSPHITAGTLVNPWGGDLFFSVEENGVRRTFKEQCISVYPEFTKVFDFKFQEGNPEALQEPDVVLLPRSMARKLFGNQSAVGKRLQFENGGHLTVGGVYKDYPRNSSVRNCIYRKMDPKENAQIWDNWNYVCYIRLDNPENAEGLFENFKEHFESSLKESGSSLGESEIVFRINPLPDVHYTTDVKYDQTPKASKQTLMVLFGIAIVIVIIAGINFTNFSTALAPMRIKSINTQKVLGGEESVIRLALISEAILISIISYLLGLLLVYIAGKTEIASLINADISLSMHVGLALITALISIGTGLLAGIYPAYYMTSFSPALVLKGSFGLSPKGRQLRNVLIGVQYVASFGLIIGAIFMYLQNYYMQNTPLGYAKDEVIVTNMNGKIWKSMDAFASQVKSFSGIEEVTFAEPLLSSQDQYMGWGRDYRDKNIQFQCLPVDPSFLRVMNVEITEGRGFREEDKAKRHGSLIFNERARTEYGLELGALVDSMEIVGFMPDIKFASFRTEVTPMAFFVWGTDVYWGSQPNYAYIKVKDGSDLHEAMRHVRATLQSFDPEYPFDVRFFDEVLNGLYEKERNLSSLITLFSLVAIFISVVGVFGLVVFDSEYRKKEIGIRKVLGSTTGEIIVMFNKTYIRILCVCFVLGAPVAGYAVYRWLENFAYKTPMYWWVYLIAFMIIALITIFTVTFQNWRAANENPVHSIKNE